MRSDLSRPCPGESSRDLRCSLREGHDGRHQHVTPAGVVTYSWEPGDPAAPPQSAVTLDELLEHVRDLAEYAAHERFVFLADQLMSVRNTALAVPQAFGRSDVAPPVPASHD